METIGKHASEDLTTPIISSQIFGHVDEQQLEILRSCIEKLSLTTGSTLFEQGTPSEAMYLVISGCVSVHRKKKNGEDELKGKILPGEPTGEIQFLTGGMHTASIRADVASELIRIPRTALEVLSKSNPDVLSHVAEYIHCRLRRYRLYDTLPRLFGKLDERIIADIERSVEWKRLNGGDMHF